MAPSGRERSARAHYFARGEGASFNISNLVEDLFESAIGFALRFVYTTGLLLVSARATTFHLLTRNRRLRITRPYPYFCFSFLLFL